MGIRNSIGQFGAGMVRSALARDAKEAAYQNPKSKTGGDDPFSKGLQKASTVRARVGMALFNNFGKASSAAPAARPTKSTYTSGDKLTMDGLMKPAPGYADTGPGWQRGTSAPAPPAYAPEAPPAYSSGGRPPAYNSGLGPPANPGGPKPMANASGGKPPFNPDALPIHGVMRPTAGYPETGPAWLKNTPQTAAPDAPATGKPPRNPDALPSDGGTYGANFIHPWK